jgi:hypothetical protein
MNMKRNFVPSDLLKDKIEHRKIEPPNFSAIYLKRNFLCRVVQVGVTPTLVYDGIRAQNLMIQNPAPTAGNLLTDTGWVTQQTGLVASGDSTAFPPTFSNYADVHLFLNVTAIAAGDTWDFILVAYDLLAGVWADSQVLVAGVTPAVVGGWWNSSFYSYIGRRGVAVDFAVRWVLVGGAGPMDFTLSYVLKDGLFGSSGGVSQIVYIISSSGGQVTAGYPLLEGTEKIFQVEEGTQIWAIAEVETPIRILELT